MGSAWLKIAAVVVLVFAGYIGYSIVTGSDSDDGSQRQKERKSKTYWDVVEEDREQFAVEPDQPGPQPNTTEKQPATDAGQEQSEQVKKPTRELTQAEKYRAEKLYQMAVNQRSMGRLPITGYGDMVDYCREIIEKYPQSKYAPKAREMLGSLPERYRQRYHITEEEIAAR